MAKYGEGKYGEGLYGVGGPPGVETTETWADLLREVKAVESQDVTVDSNRWAAGA